MAKTKIEVDLEIKDGDSVSQAESKAKSLKQQLKEMKELLASGTLGQKEFTALAQKAGELQDRIGDVNQRVKNLASDSQKLEGFVSLTQGIVGGFAAVQGITALVGEENEDLQKTMVKLQAATSALAGIQAIANTLNKDSAALVALNTVRTTAMTAAQAAYTFVVGTSTGAMKLFRIALAASGIGLIVLGLVAAAKAMGAFGDATDKTTEEIEKQTEAIKKRAAANKELDDLSINQLKRETEIDKQRMKLAGASDEELRKKDIEYLKFKKGILEQQFKDNKGDAEAQKKITDELYQVQFEIVSSGLQAQQAAKDKAQKEDQARAEENKRRDERIAEQKKKESLRDLQQQLEDEAERKDNAEILAASERQKELDAQARMIAQGEAERSLRQKLREREAKEREEELQKIASYELAKQQIVSGSFDVLNNIGELFIGQQYKQTAIGKTIALAQIAIDTAKAISSLTAASEANPTNSVTYGLAGAAQFVAGLARITGNVLQAKRVLEGGSVGGASSGAGGSSISIPNSQPPQIPDLNRGAAPKGTIKVVVLENDITTTVDRVIKIRENAEVE